MTQTRPRLLFASYHCLLDPFSKLVLIPALCQVTFGRVSVEAMLNGIPVLSNDRRAMPEVIGDGGYLFNVPAKYTEHSQEVRTAEEVSPWIEAIIQLWDDPQRCDIVDSTRPG